MWMVTEFTGRVESSFVTPVLSRVGTDSNPGSDWRLGTGSDPFFCGPFEL